MFITLLGELGVISHHNSQVASENCRMATLGDYVKKYGLAPTPLLPGPSRSSLTISPAQPIVPRTYQINREHEYYQQSKLHGYTSQMLRELDVISYRTVMPNNLSNPNHRIVKQRNWFGTADPAIEILVHPLSIVFPNMLGDFSGKNPLVWDQLEPCLNLTSHLLSKIYLNPWVNQPLIQEFGTPHADMI